MAPFEKTGSQMNVENVQHYVERNQNVRAKATAALAVSPADVVVPAELYRQAAERHVAIRAAVQCAVLTKTPLVLFKIFVNAARLIVFNRSVLQVEDFLNGNDIGVQLFDYGRNALGAGAPIEAPALMNVVGCDTDPADHC